MFSNGCECESHKAEWWDSKIAGKTRGNQEDEDDDWNGDDDDDVESDE